MSKPLNIVAALLMASSFAAANLSTAAPYSPGPSIAKNGKGKGHGNDSHPSEHGKGNGANEPGHHGSGHGGSDEHGARFAPHDRDVVSNYYEHELANGNCPPGLAKKHNGCLPPGQAKKAWNAGARLPNDVRYYDLPGDLASQLQPLPYGYRYVSVDGDVLLIAVSTLIIIDVIQIY